MDKLQDEEGIQCRPTALDFACKHPVNDRNSVGTATSRTSGKKHRPQRAEGIIASSWGFGLAAATVHGQCTSDRSEAMSACDSTVQASVALPHVQHVEEIVNDLMSHDM